MDTEMTAPARPSLAELRAVCQPPERMARRSGEHWAGLLYMRRVSLRVTRVLVGTRVTPNQLTSLMTVSGAATGPLLLIPGAGGAVLAALAMQGYLLLDCVDGEVARWKRMSSLTGVYLDRIGAYLAEASLFVGAGFRADRLHPGGYALLGVVAALGAVLIKAETDLVEVARYHGGRPQLRDDGVAQTPRSVATARARRIAAALRFHRLIGGIEASLVLLLVGIVDAARASGDGVTFTRVAVAVFAVIALVQLVLHLVSILASSRLR
jgi:phosphatidylglycerophosphate synthase